MNIQMLAQDSVPILSSTNLPIITYLRSVIDGKLLPSYAVTADEMALLQRTNITTLFSPLGFLGAQGYNSANYLIGLWISASFFEFSMIFT